MRKIFIAAIVFFFIGGIFLVLSAMNYNGYLYQLEQMKKYPLCDHCLPVSESSLSASKFYAIYGLVVTAGGGVTIGIDRLQKNSSTTNS